MKILFAILFALGILGLLVLICKFTNLSDEDNEGYNYNPNIKESKEK